jgi:hypothetical protein
VAIAAAYRQAVLSGNGHTLAKRQPRSKAALCLCGHPVGAEISFLCQSGTPEGIDIIARDLKVKSEDLGSGIIIKLQQYVQLTESIRKLSFGKLTRRVVVFVKDLKFHFYLLIFSVDCTR